ncbi:MAG: response regulator transcription factor [Gammaproteobacteria bacterium]|nr:response regulator transcription factor [Gammaproteobacteria bacterium]
MVEAACILVVEDNADLAFGLRTNLEVEGYQVILAEDGQAGLACALNDKPDMIILDLMLPKLNGIDVLKRIRKKDASIPILILTAKGNEVDKVLGLRLGADDYVTKPFALMELIARVEALLRRAGNQSRPGNVNYDFGDIHVCTETQQVIRNGLVIEMTPKEYGLLLALLVRNGSVATRMELMKEVWGHSSAVVSRTVDTHIAELRRKLEDDPARPNYIVTIRSSGYRLVANRMQSSPDTPPD